MERILREGRACDSPECFQISVRQTSIVWAMIKRPVHIKFNRNLKDLIYFSGK